jgi:hypothetical protein
VQEDDRNAAARAARQEMRAYPLRNHHARLDAGQMLDAGHDVCRL